MPFNSTMKLGVLDDTQLLAYSYNSKQYSRVEETFPGNYRMEALVSIAHDFGLDSLWIAPGSELSRASQHMMLHLDRDMFDCYSSKGTQHWPRFLLMWRKSGTLAERKSVKMAWPEWDPRWPWSSCTDAQTLLRSVLYLQDAIEAEIAWSPGHVGQELMLTHVREDWLTPCEMPSIIKKNLATDLQWKRPLTTEEMRIGMYIHLFDKRSMYLAACTSANLGEGDPMHWEGDDIQFNALYPGIWRLATAWYWTPQLELYMQGDDAVRPHIHEAWVWPRYHQALRGWAEHLWDARRELQDDSTWGGGNYPYTDVDARTFAHNAVKMIATQGLGWLAMESKQGDNKLYRPDWWSQIVATARRNMAFKTRQLTRAGMEPAYVNVDTVGLVSYGESIEKYKALLLSREGRLGSFRHVGSVPCTQEIITLFEDAAPFSACQNAIVQALEGVRYAETS